MQLVSQGRDTIGHAVPLHERHKGQRDAAGKKGQEVVGERGVGDEAEAGSHIADDSEVIGVIVV